MSSPADTTARRFGQYIERLQNLFRSHGISSLESLISNVRQNEQFRHEWKQIWSDIAHADGGKLSLTTAGVILGSAMGGVGIAMMGGAFGLPLAAVLGLGGYLLGSQWDGRGGILGKSALRLAVPKPLYERMEAAAKVSQVDPEDLVISTLEEAFPAKYPAPFNQHGAIPPA